jgi:putative surface-exposed virulence protein
MKTRSILTYICAALLICFSLSFLITSPVLADTETPPETVVDTQTTPAPTDGVATDVAETTANVTDAATEVPSETPVDLVVPTTEGLPTLTLDPTEMGIVEETAAPTVEAALAGDETTPEEALVEALAETDSVMLDSEGNPISLASVEASTVAQGEDPYFIAGGVYIGYTTTGTCNALVLPANCHTVGSNALSAAVTAYTTTYAATATGAIYIEAGTYTQTSSITITSGSNLTGIIGAGSDPTTGTTIAFSNNMSLTVSNTTLGFALQGVNITGNTPGGLVNFSNNTGVLNVTDVAVKNTNASGDGIIITGQTGAVNINRVESSSNGDEGLKVTATGNITIKNSNFDWNSGSYSMAVTSTAGNITLDGVSSSHNNSGNGANLLAKTGVKVSNSSFSNNFGQGLVLDTGSAGANTFTMVFVNYNNQDNIHIEDTVGAITMTDVQANQSNNGYGIYIDNCNASSGVCTAATAGAVTLTGITAQYDTMANIYIVGSGAITLTNVDAYYAYNSGAVYLDNHYAKSASAVTATKIIADYGDSIGLTVYSKGNVTLNTIQASSAGTYGIYVDNTSGTGSVTIGQSVGRSVINNAGDTGIVVWSKGNVTISGVDLYSCTNTGIDIESYQGTGAVTISDSTVTSTDVNSIKGAIYVLANGNITLTSVTSNSNAGMGINLNNSIASSPRTVTLTNSSASSNTYDGILILSKGNISLIGVTADNNNNPGSNHTYGGVMLDNTYGTGSVTVTNSEMDGSYIGLHIMSHGSVTLDNVIASSNDTVGVWIENNGGTGTVTVKRSNIGSNGSDGLDVVSRGLITLSSVNISYNNTSGSYGASLVNIGGTAGVTITGTNTDRNYFDYNFNTGLYIHTNGPVNISYVQSSGNTNNRGIDIQVDGTGAVTITNVTANSNKWEGLHVVANGNITVTNPYIYGNDSSLYGVYLDNSAGTGSVTIQGTSASSRGTIANNNDTSTGMNLEILSKGAVTVKYLNTDTAITGGIHINNVATAGNPVTIMGVSAISTTSGTGLYIESNGTVSVTDATIADSSGYGLEIVNNGGTVKNVTISLSSVYDNHGGNIMVYSKGLVTLAGVSANTSTAGYGIRINNTFGTTAGITITSSGATTNYANSNFLDGVYLTSNGPISVTKLYASNNHGINLNINNSSGTGGVTLNTVAVYDSSTSHGIYVQTNGVFSATNIIANGNNQNGLMIYKMSGTTNTTITNGTFYSNAGSYAGLYIDSDGLVTLTNIQSKYNTGYGLQVDNSAGLGVTLQSTSPNRNDFIGDYIGVSITTPGPVKISNTYSAGNDYQGIYVDNTSGTGTVTLTNVTGYADSSYGIEIESYGAVTGTNLSASGNSSSPAVYINNCQYNGVSCEGSGNVTLTGVTAQAGNVGLEVLSNGTITVTNGDLSYNYYGAGAFLDNSLSSTSAPIYVYTTKANHNGDDGITIYTKGNVVLDGVTAESNSNSGTYGVFIYNAGAGSTGNVTVSSARGANNFNNNNADGIRILTNGNISLSKVTANYNGQYGIFAYTYGTGKSLNITTGTIMWNGYSGIYGVADADSAFSGVKVFNNGLNQSGYDGITLTLGNHNFTLTNSYVTANSRYGLNVSVSGPANIVKLVGSYFFGNDHYVSGPAGVKDINTTGTVQIS